MSKENIYAAMRQSEMCNWVGGGDPEVIGVANFTCIIENLPLQHSDAVLDFGCGIGRTSVLLAEFLNQGGQLVGSDIVPGQIRFCREQFASAFPDVTFYCVRSSNPQYDNLTAATADATPVIGEDEFFLQHRQLFDVVVGFSVFTHFNPPMAGHFLKQLRDATKPGGHLLLTWFLDHPDNPANFSGFPAKLGAGEEFSDPSGNLFFGLFSPVLVSELAARADLLVERISYGSWRGGQWPLMPLKGQHAQDLVILRRPLPTEFDANIYLKIHQDVAAAEVDPLQHYLTFGCREGRRLR
jgi:SAM-dependent methyltransferase